MLINLAKSFSFQKEKYAYDVGYIFQKDAAEGNEKSAGVWLVLTVSINKGSKRVYTVSKPTSLLYHSNKIIEQLIEAEVLSLTNGPSKNPAVA